MKPLCIPVLGVFWAPLLCTASVIVNHAPHPYGGPTSDTAFYPPLWQQPAWQRLADDFILASDDVAVSLQWFGFYDADNPPASETMRIRFYDARASDGLPGNVLYEESFANPSRVATGQIIHTGVSPREYVFSATFSTPLNLEKDTHYWLEVVQLGDLMTTFRWEDSITDSNGYSFANILSPDWQSSMPGGFGDLSFRINSPEPSVTWLVVLAGAVLMIRREGGRRQC